MTSSLSDRDHELLSAYLDNQLSPGDKTGLERRLATEPELREALSALRATVRALRSLPTVKAPRRFTLDPKVYHRAVAPERRSYGILRWATALATFLFVIVVAGDFISQSRLAFVAAPQPAAAPAQRERLPAEAAATEAAALEAAAPAPTEAPAVAAAPPVEAAGAAAPPETVVGGGQGGAVTEAQSFAAPTQAVKAVTSSPAAADLASQTTAAPAGTPGAATRLVATPAIAPSETPAAVAQAPPAVEATSAAPAGGPPPTLSWLRLVEIGLGLLALGLAVTTFRSRKRTS